MTWANSDNQSPPTSLILTFQKAQRLLSSTPAFGLQRPTNPTPQSRYNHPATNQQHGSPTVQPRAASGWVSESGRSRPPALLKPRRANPLTGGKTASLLTKKEKEPPKSRAVYYAQSSRKILKFIPSQSRRLVPLCYTEVAIKAFNGQQVSGATVQHKPFKSLWSTWTRKISSWKKLSKQLLSFACRTAKKLLPKAPKKNIKCSPLFKTATARPTMLTWGGKEERIRASGHRCNASVPAPDATSSH